MRVLLDTQVFLWWITDNELLSDQARRIISDGENDLYFSAGSGWEIVIKAKLGKLHLPNDNPERFVAEQLNRNNIQSLPIHMSHALNVYNLPEHHRDPFDRILISQSQLEDLPILSADSILTQYPIQVIW